MRQRAHSLLAVAISMLLRQHIAPLVALAAGLVLVASACASSTGSGEITLAGQRFSVKSGDVFSHPVDSIEEMERVGGFPFVFPSYLPDGMDERMALGAWAGGEETLGGMTTMRGGPEESVRIYRKHGEETFAIFITESRPPFPKDWPGAYYSRESHAVGGTDIFCDVIELKGPVMTCGWLVEDNGFKIEFLWAAGSPLPGIITDDMREEALKVIQSMIEAPIQVEPAKSE